MGESKLKLHELREEEACRVIQKEKINEKRKLYEQSAVARQIIFIFLRRSEKLVEGAEMRVLR